MKMLAKHLEWPTTPIPGVHERSENINQKLRKRLETKSRNEEILHPGPQSARITPWWPHHPHSQCC